MRGRTKPYTERGIRRIPCPRCGKPSVHQWQICATGRIFMPMCAKCDVELNEYILTFFNYPNREALMDTYIRKAFASSLTEPACAKNSKKNCSAETSP